ncbi:MAG: urate hydroxylase PuuD, partial [Bradymonadaceae bacterium]
MPAHLVDWLDLLVRWAHVTIGIAWIGSSFYFNWLENSLNREDPRDHIDGSLWAVHGGGFYFVEKLDVAPDEMPDKLHWFMYEAYFTWITGICLLTIVYYLRPGTYLVGPESIVGSGMAIGIGLGSLIVGWLVYHGLARAQIGRVNLTIVGFLAMTVVAWGFTQVFSPRAAFIHV